MPPRKPYRHRPLTVATVAGILSLVLPTVTLIRLYTATHSLLPIAYTCAVSSVTFVLYGYDKMQARSMEWRVAEVKLHFLAMVGGWPGALAGMHYFQHKTRKVGFQVGFWGIVMGWHGLLWGFWRGGL
ncbi:DUF1294-domain-containing protein [Dothidotthia symphoricarpi CBS 119687]|uniref:DUF1294-domain-containing protein n=1 Tax=Dothidotthia symphoricarpi CBS 119687 TaxID=1392245 RepID=A0A6A6ALL0_9PLEO|nr:DUF1294-domain-containing protein [Dothidotthia symphoricarpi CBS 119687]KAF2132690.1 DUF1294-domain-containing protein [Dothidotthia symphoricarpi CBS 119687]